MECAGATSGLSEVAIAIVAIEVVQRGQFVDALSAELNEHHAEAHACDSVHCATEIALTSSSAAGNEEIPQPSCREVKQQH